MRKDFGDMIPLAADFAAERFATVFRGKHLAYELGAHFTCTEVDHLADLLHANGDAAGAQFWINGHFHDCDEPGEHGVYSSSVFEMPETTAA